MSLFKWFSSEERKRRYLKRQENKRIHDHEWLLNICDPSKRDYLLDLVIKVGQMIERRCDWPPSKDQYSLYLKSLYVQAVMYLFLAENIYLVEAYASDQYSRSSVLTWQRAARASYQIAQRALVALNKLTYSNPGIGEIRLSFNNMLERATKAEQVTLEDAMKRNSYSWDNNPYVGTSGMSRMVHAPEIVGAARGKFGPIKISAIDKGKYFHGWFSEDIEPLIMRAEILQTIPFNNMRVVFEKDTDLYQDLNDKTGNWKIRHVDKPSIPSYIKLIVSISNKQNLSLSGEMPLERTYNFEPSGDFLITGVQHAYLDANVLSKKKYHYAPFKAKVFVDKKDSRQKSRTKARITINVDSNGFVSVDAFDQLSDSKLKVLQVI